mgnify:CR=1 FL=1
MKDRVHVAPLGEISGLVIRRGIPHTAVAPTGKVPVYAIRALREGLDPIGYVDLPTPRFGEEYLTRPGDILVSLDNPGPKNVLLVDENMPQCAVRQQIIVIRIEDRSMFDPSFLFGWVCGPGFQGDLTRYSSGQAMPRVRLDDVLRIPIPIPPLEEQRQLGMRLHQLESAADIHLRVANTIARLRQLQLSEMVATYAGDAMVGVQDE